jgi:hypothetical protein
MPVTFEVGHFLLDGPAKGPLTTAINAPVLALFGFEYYTVTGGLVLGLAFGIVAAILAVSLVGSFRRRMAKLEEGSEKYQKYAGKGWVKVLSWLLFGKGKGKKTYAQLLDKRMGNPIRILGVIAVFLAVGLLYIAQMFFKDEITTTLVRKNLEQANGATVDLEKASLDIAGGKLLLTKLAVADPKKLETDIFRATTLESTINTRDLLRKRIALDQVTSADASTGEERKMRGFLVNPKPRPPATPKEPGQKTIDDYIKQGEIWKERLAQAKDWLDEIDRRRQDDAGTPGDPGAPGQKETLRDRLRREVKEQGWARVRAWHLIEKSPTILVRAIDITGMKAPPLPGKTEPELLDVRARNLSTQPWLVAEAPEISVKSRGQTLDFAAAFGGVASSATPSTITLAYRGLPNDLIGEQLKLAGTAKPLQGGTMDISAKGVLGSGIIDLPLNVTLRDTTMTLPQAGSAPIKEMLLPIGVSGPLNDPRILFDQKAFADALAQAGANELAAKARGEVDKVVNKATEDLTKKVGDKLGDNIPGNLKDQIPSGIGNLLPGGGGKKK